MRPEVSFIINHYQRPELLRRCIESIKTYIKNCFYEIIVTDSGTEDETVKLMQNNFPDITYIPTKDDIGFAKSVNAGVKRTRGDILGILNADIEFIDSSPELLLDFIKKEKWVGLVGPLLINNDNNDGTIQESCFRFYKPQTILFRRTWLGKLPWGKKDNDRFFMRDVDIIKKPIPVDWLRGSSLFIRSEIWKELGGLDERYFMYFEDVDLARTCWEKGYKVIFYPQTRLLHHYERASKKLGGILDILFNFYGRVHLKSALKYFLKYGLSTPRYGL